MAIRAGHVEQIKSGGWIQDGQAREVVRDHLEELARAGTRRILMEALEEKVENYLGRGPYKRSEKFRGYRNGGVRQRLHAAVVHDLREAGDDRAADCLADDLDRGLTFYRFREAHWAHLRTTNPSESVFSGVRLRTNTARRFKKTRSGVCLMHQCWRA